MSHHHHHHDRHGAENVTVFELSETSWAERLASSVGGALLGVVVIGGSVALLWWNERRTVQRKAALAEVEKALKKTGNTSRRPADLAAVANGAIVHVVGTPDVQEAEAARDPLLTVRRCGELDCEP